MLTNPEKDEDLVIDGKNISADAKIVAEQATLAVKQWIDQQLTGITQSARDELATTQKSLDGIFADVDTALVESKRSLETINAIIEQAKLDFKDPAKLAKAITDLETTTKAAVADLDKRKELFRAGGTAAAGALGKVIKTLAL